MEAATGLGVRTCAVCNGETATRFRVCVHCGTVFPGQTAVEEFRRSVTVVQSDLKGSTALGEKLDPESLREVMTLYIDEMRRVFESHGGTIEKIIGDAVIAVFGMPVRRDDDALRALEGAADSLIALANLNELLEASWGVRLVTRTGVASGEVVFGDLSASQHVLTGDTMRVAGAMEQNGPPLEVLVADSTRRLVGDRVAFEPMGPVTPKGAIQSVDTWRLVSIVAPSTRADDDVSSGVRMCSNCGEENPSEARFCGTCAAPLAVVKAKESRKTVTIVFADPKPATEDGSPASAEAIRDVMSRYFDAMKIALERHGGTVEKFIGDAVMAVFGLPVRHEDDAVRASRAALDMQAALPALNDAFAAEWGVRLGNHIGVNTGEVIAGDATLGQRLVTGDAVNVAARLEQSAGAHEVIVGDLTYRLARDFVEVEPIAPLTLKGKSEPVPAYRLLKVRAAAAERPTGAAPFVGREAEMVRLASTLADVIDERHAKLLTVVGDAGVGKSRLIKEFATRVGEVASVLRGRCLPYGDGITFWPFAEIVREAAQITADDTPDSAVSKIRALVWTEGDAETRDRIVERVAAVIGLSPAPFPVSELFWGARKLIETIGRHRPVVLLVDDIHSAEQTFLELLDHLEEAIEQSPVLILCSARNELSERHSEWAESHQTALVVLEPLSDEDAGEVVEKLLGSSGLDRSVVDRITAAAEGNPLFVEQMVSMLIDNGTLRMEDGRWVASRGSQIAVPPSITALIAARVDSLPGDERSVLEPASVIGLSFAVPAVEELLEEGLRPVIQPALHSVERKQFVRPTKLDEDDAYKFAHILVKDTTYESLLKRVRASYHVRFVDWAERVNAERGRGQEFEEIHGYHLEQAYRYLTELGVIDESARLLGRRAAGKLSSAGRRALVRGDSPAAANLLLRAAGVLPELDQGRVELLTEAADAEIELGQFEDASGVLAKANDASAALDDARLLARVALIRQHLNQRTTGSFGDPQKVTNLIQDMVPVLESAEDFVGLTLAWHWLSFIYYTTGALDQASDAASRVVEIASRAGNGPLAARSAVLFLQIAVDSALPVADAIARSEQLATVVSQDRKTEARFLASRAILDAMEGRVDRAREQYRRSEQMMTEMGARVTAAGSSLDWARVEMLAGDHAAAEELLRNALAILEPIDERFYQPTVAAVLAQALYAQGCYDEAGDVMRAAEKMTAEDDTFTLIVLASTRAKLLARAGDSEEALRTAREALALAKGGYAYQFAETQLDLAEVCRLTSLEDPEPPLREALGFFVAKGDVVTSARVSSLVAGLGETVEA